MSPVFVPCMLVWHLFFFVSGVVECVNGQVGGWINAHATFYGANQAPSTLGKLHKTLLIFFYLE